MIKKNRRAVSTFANEQTIREIYLKPFEISITEGGADSIMSSLNRIGCTSSVVHKGLLTEVLKKNGDLQALLNQIRHLDFLI